ncbi:MAG: hypothetical protein WBG08_12685 [Litorimonas sp.]
MYNVAMKLRLLLLIPFLLFCPSHSDAQLDGGYGLDLVTEHRISGIERDYEAMVRALAPEFRLIDEVEVFPPIQGNTIDVPVDFNTSDTARLTREGAPPLIAALHDRRDGRPIASCQAPCVMKAPKVPPPMLMLYRYGSKPYEMGSEMRSLFDPVVDLYLPFNEVDHLFIRRECEAAFEAILAAHTERDAEPCHRAAPIMPFEATTSGVCRVVFNTSRSGEPIDVQTEACTDQVFCEATTEAVNRFIYHPAIKFGEAVERRGIETKMTYRLADEMGRIIEADEDVMLPCVGSV